MTKEQEIYKIVEKFLESFEIESIDEYVEKETSSIEATDVYRFAFDLATVFFKKENENGK